MLAELHKLTEYHLERAQPDDLLSAITPVQQALNDIRSKYLEEKQREQDQPSLRPQKRVLGTRRQVIDDHYSREFQDVVYDMPLKETLERVLKHNAFVMTDIMKAAELWEAAAAVAPADVVFSDFYHGHAFKTHKGFSSGAPPSPCLIDRLTCYLLWCMSLFTLPGTESLALFVTSSPPTTGPIAENEVRLPIMFYGDGVTVANPIGVYRNNSKVMLMYWGMMLLPGLLSSNPLAARSAAPDTAVPFV